MNLGGDKHQRDWDEQRETISAYVDGALSPEERADFEEHLSGCPACRSELEAVRQVRALLRQMPEPALPRSFLLPATPDASPATTPAPVAPRRSSRVVPFTQRAGRVAQMVGTLAAAIGLVLLLGSALVGHGSTGSNSTAGVSNSSALAPQTSATARQPAPAYGSAQQTPREGTSGAQSTESRPATPDTPTTAAPPSPSATSVPTLTPSSAGTGAPVALSSNQGPPFAPLTGGGLLVGGAAVAVAGRLMSRRGRSMRTR